MDPRINYPLVGAFVLLLGGALVYSALWLSEDDSDKVYDHYVAYFYESVAGLNRRAAVKYRGVDVGLVRRIGLDNENPERVRLLLSIEAGTPVKEDSVAVLAAYGITGLVFVDLTGGSQASPPLKARKGERYPEIRTGPSLLSTASSGLMQIAEVANELHHVAERLNALLNPENREAMGKILQNIEQITAVLAGSGRQFDDKLQRLDAILGNATRASEGLPKAIDGVSVGMSGVQAASQAVVRSAANLDQLIEETRTGLNKVSKVSTETLGHAAPVVGELRQVLANLRRLSRELEQHPDALLFGRTQRPGPGE
ncbi:MAG: MlaD family protein [Gammaproteobacteria bacterium]